MKISSETEICNLALLKVGQNTISSYDDINDQSIQAQLCRYTYDQARQSLLSQYQWSFACTESNLSKILGQSPIKYNFRYSLPEGFLRLVTLYDSSNREIIANTGYKPAYDIQSGELLTDIDGCKIKYVFDQETVSQMSPLFIDALVLNIATRITKLLNDSSAYLQQLQQDYQMTFMQAKIEDARQKQINQVQSYPMWMESRLF